MAITNPNDQQSNQPGSSPRQNGTGFTNLQTIMGANQGNKLGQAVAGGIQQTGQQATNALQQGQQDFNTQSQNNALGTQDQQQYVQNTLGNMGIGEDGKPKSDTSNITNPTDNDVSNFSKYMSGQYNGPKDISNISSIQNQAQNAQQQGQAVSTAGGRQALLQQYAAKPGSTYGAGAQNLDSTLLGATGGNQLQQARQSVSGLNNQVNSAEVAAQQQAQQLQNQAQGFGQQVTGQVTGAKNYIYGNAQSQADKDNAAQTVGFNNWQQATQAAQNGTLSADAANALGLNSGDRTYGVNVGQYISYDQNGQPITNAMQLQQANALNEITQPQYQQYSGLSKLLGQTPEQQQAQFQAATQNYDKTGLQSAISSAKAPLDAAQKQMNQNQTFVNWSNNHLTDQETRDAQAYAAANGGLARFNNQLGQVLWNKYLSDSGQGGNNSAYLQNGWANGQWGKATQQYNLLNNQLNGTINVPQVTT